jgi:hypothetical protein
LGVDCIPPHPNYRIAAKFRNVTNDGQNPAVFMAIWESFDYQKIKFPLKYINHTTWFFMMPSIATKFQYVNSLLFSFSLTTCFDPYGPSSGEIYN